MSDARSTLEQPHEAVGREASYTRHEGDSVLDVTEVVARLLARHEATVSPDRVRLVAPLVAPAYANRRSSRCARGASA